MVKTYSDLIRIPDYMGRYNYLKLGGQVGIATFGWDRWINQQFYSSYDWKKLRDKIITRDMGLDMALAGYEIPGRVIVHHMNPIKIDDIVERSEYLMNPEYLVCVSEVVHNAIHYGDESQLNQNILIERRSGDTCPWG